MVCHFQYHILSVHPATSRQSQSNSNYRISFKIKSHKPISDTSSNTMSTLATQKTVLITGCSEGGIGHSLALEFARQNYHVFATARRLSAMKSLSENPNITLLELDVTSKSSILSASEAVTKATGGTLDVLYHNAGARSIVLAIHSDWKLAEDTFKVNFFAVVEMTRVFIPLILRAGAGSKIVFSNSVAALVPVPTQSIYDASKAALDAYAKVLDLEVRPLGIQVVNVITGEVGTSMAEGKMGVLADGKYQYTIDTTV